MKKSPVRGFFLRQCPGWPVILRNPILQQRLAKHQSSTTVLLAGEYMPAGDPQSGHASGPDKLLLMQANYSGNAGAGGLLCYLLDATIKMPDHCLALAIQTIFWRTRLMPAKQARIVVCAWSIAMADKSDEHVSVPVRLPASRT